MAEGDRVKAPRACQPADGFGDLLASLLVVDLPGHLTTPSDASVLPALDSSCYDAIALHNRGRRRR